MTIPLLWSNSSRLAFHQSYCFLILWRDFFCLSSRNLHFVVCLEIFTLYLLVDGQFPGVLRHEEKRSSTSKLIPMFWEIWPFVVGIKSNIQLLLIALQNWSFHVHILAWCTKNSVHSILFTIFIFNFHTKCGSNSFQLVYWGWNKRFVHFLLLFI